MKYYSELLKEIFDTEDELRKAEEAKMYEDKEKNEMIEKLCALAEARDRMVKEYNDYKDEYIEKYGSLVLEKKEDGSYEVGKTKFLTEFPFFCRAFD